LPLSNVTSLISEQASHVIADRRLTRRGVSIEKAVYFNLAVSSIFRKGWRWTHFM
jgi:hypothetical protein